MGKKLTSICKQVCVGGPPFSPPFDQKSTRHFAPLRVGEGCRHSMPPPTMGLRQVEGYFTAIDFGIYTEEVQEFISEAVNHCL